ASLLLIDLDNLMVLNQDGGRAVGAKAIDVATKVLAAAGKAEGWTFGRIGGDEFALLAPGVPLESAFLRAARPREQLAAARRRASQEEGGGPPPRGPRRPAPQVRARLSASLSGARRAPRGSAGPRGSAAEATRASARRPRGSRARPPRRGTCPPPGRASAGKAAPCCSAPRCARAPPAGRSAVRTARGARASRPRARRRSEAPRRRCRGGPGRGSSRRRWPRSSPPAPPCRERRAAPRGTAPPPAARDPRSPGRARDNAHGAGRLRRSPRRPPMPRRRPGPCDPPPDARV